MAESSLLELLEPHRDQAWHPGVPDPEEDIAAAEAAMGRRFPEDYRHALRSVGGSGVYGPESKLVLIPARHLTQFNPDTERFPDLTEMLIFAHDEGDYIYFYDSRNLLGRGPSAIFAMEMGVTSRANATFVARDLQHLVERILAGEAVIE